MHIEQNGFVEKTRWNACEYCEECTEESNKRIKNKQKKRKDMLVFLLDG